MIDLQYRYKKNAVIPNVVKNLKNNIFN